MATISCFSVQVDLNLKRNQYTFDLILRRSSPAILRLRCFLTKRHSPTFPPLPAPPSNLEHPGRSITPPLLGIHTINEPQTFPNIPLTSIGVAWKATFIYHLTTAPPARHISNCKKLASQPPSRSQSVLGLWCFHLPSTTPLPSQIIGERVESAATVQIWQKQVRYYYLAAAALSHQLELSAIGSSVQ